MKPHHWIATGSAPLMRDQASRWAEASDMRIIDEPLEISFDMVTCAACLELREDVTNDECPGPPEGYEEDHLWMGRLVAMLTAEQADAWVDPDQTFHPGYPRSVSLSCILCGADGDDARPGCPERMLWKT